MENTLFLEKLLRELISSIQLNTKDLHPEDPKPWSKLIIAVKLKKLLKLND
jgi:hypothetical protein